MSRKGNCYDNATMESFWSALKRELVSQWHFATRDQAPLTGSKSFYNRVRLHSALGYQSSVDF